MSETPLSKAIVDALATVGAFAIRVNSGSVRVRGGYMHLAPKGTPDIYVLVPPTGLSLWLEVKTLTGEMRESQLAWAAKARARGALVETVRTVAEALEAYRRAVEASKLKASA